MMLRAVATGARASRRAAAAAAAAARSSRVLCVLHEAHLSQQQQQQLVQRAGFTAGGERPWTRSFSSAPAAGGGDDGVAGAPGVESPGDKFVMIYTCSGAFAADGSSRKR